MYTISSFCISFLYTFYSIYLLIMYIPFLYLLMYIPFICIYLLYVYTFCITSLQLSSRLYIPSPLLYCIPSLQLSSSDLGIVQRFSFLRPRDGWVYLILTKIITTYIITTYRNRARRNLYQRQRERDGNGRERQRELKSQGGAVVCWSTFFFVSDFIRVLGTIFQALA